ncbi:MAG: hypothetical protein KTR16_04885 [Acidiferrobacterales bacterium]|nr:hypothetical protein [Acidiferrobacterales bacterium]
MSAMCRSSLIILISLKWLFCGSAFAFQLTDPHSVFKLTNVTADEKGFLKNTNNDGQLVIDSLNLKRSDMCGVLLTLEFKTSPLRATLFEVYWASEKANFSEHQKGFFFINQSDTEKENKYALSLCKLFNFSGNLHQSLQQANITAFRLDFPPNKNIDISVSSIAFLNSQALTKEINEDDDIIKTEVYERVPAKSFITLDVIIPKLIFAFEEGLQKISKDLAFLIFWLFLIFILKLLLLRSFARQYKTRDDS